MTSHLQLTPHRSLRLHVTSPIAVLTSGGRMLLALLLCAAFFLVIAPPAQAAQVCGGLDSGKIDTKGDPASVTVTAPKGQLISGYCVKAGSEKQGDGPRYVTLNPPVSTVTITHPSGKDVSHYSLSYVDAVTDACKDIDGNQPKGTDCAQPRTTVTSTSTDAAPDCVTKTVTTTTVTTTTTYSFNDATDKWVANPSEKTTTTTRRRANDQECPGNTEDVCKNIKGDQSEVPAGLVLDGTDCVKPEVVTPPGKTPPGNTPPVVVTPPSQGGVVVPPAAGGPKPGQGVGNTPGHTPGTVTPGTTPDSTPGTVVVSTPGTVGVPTAVAAGLGTEAATSSRSATMSLFGGGLLFVVASLLLSRRRVR